MTLTTPPVVWPYSASRQLQSRPSIRPWWTCYVPSRGKGRPVAIVPVGSGGLVDVQELAESVDDETLVDSAMVANNEIGVVQPVCEISEVCRRAGAAGVGRRSAAPTACVISGGRRAAAARPTGTTTPSASSVGSCSSTRSRRSSTSVWKAAHSFHREGSPQFGVLGVDARAGHSRGQGRPSGGLRAGVRSQYPMTRLRNRRGERAAP